MDMCSDYDGDIVGDRQDYGKFIKNMMPYVCELLLI